MTLPNDHLERVYAGILGKLIGVYLGRPFEGWTHERILRELGPIEYYVHDRLGDPLVVTDDDVAGTFTFVRALEDHGASENLSAEDIGRTWLNYIVEKRAILWWGGRGNSTEHTAWLNLRNGIPAPASGAIATNGLTVAEQIGAQIFIDGWALVAPGKPALAAKLARQAGSVSHDGESVHAAVLWAAMEAEAFVSDDVEHLIETGLSAIPSDSRIAGLITDIRNWRERFPDWHDCRRKIADVYGYDRFHGNCHVMPNHALMIMALLYAPHDFSLGQTIVNTSGWDTDCNAGNLGCLHGIMLGLDGLGGGPDWRGPVADRMLISSADGGNSINDAVNMAYYIANLGRNLDGEAPLVSPKDGARFHFSLPGSTQGFRIAEGVGSVAGVAHGGVSVLEIRCDNGDPVTATTPTFSPPDVLRMRTYDLMATPLVYPGQTISARVEAGANAGPVVVALRVRRYGEDDALVAVDGEAATLDPGETATLAWTIPDCGGQPIAEIGLLVTPADGNGATVYLDRMGWSGTPDLTLRRPDRPGDFWRRAWVNGADLFSKRFRQSFHISQDRGEGFIAHGTRDWTDYRVAADVVMHLARHAGLMARMQGLCRYYAALVGRDGVFEIVRVHDDTREVLARTEIEVAFDEWISMSLTVEGNRIAASARGVTLSAIDTSNRAVASGGIGLLVADGAASADVIRVSSP